MVPAAAAIMAITFAAHLITVAAAVATVAAKRLNDKKGAGIRAFPD